MKKLLSFSTLASLLIFGSHYSAYAQAVGISGTGSVPNPSALLDVDATGMNPKKGFLIPRLTTTERDALATTCSCTPAEGLMIYNTTTKCFDAYVNGAWNTGFCPSACTPPAAPTANAASSLACTSFTANWSASSGATSYFLDVSLNSGFSSFVAGYNNLNVGNVISSSVTGLASNTSYYYRVRATTACVSGNSNTITAVTTTIPAAAGTISGTTPLCQSQNGVAFSVGAISGATSYTWSYSGTGYTCATNCTTNSITANFSGTATGGNLTVYGTNTCGNGTTSSNYAIAVSATPTTANAGSAINTACDVTTATLAGNSPSVGSGTWSCISGCAGLSITTPGSPTSGVTGIAVPGTTTLRWTISNSPCTASTSDVVITTTSCFTCGTSTIVYGGQTYNTVLRGTQCWMKENLNIGTRINGVTAQTNNSSIEKYCYNDDASGQCVTYGGLYQWAEAMQYKDGCTNTTSLQPTTPVQGICPSGWHIPTDAEWITLEEFQGMCSGAGAGCSGASGWRGTNEGDELKTTTGWTTNSGTNTSGFSALPGGYRHTDGSFSQVGNSTRWWSASQSSASFAWLRHLYYSQPDVSRYTEVKTYGWSIRCLKD